MFRKTLRGYGLGLFVLITLFQVSATMILFSQNSSLQPMSNGKSLISVKTYSAEEDQRTLKIYEGLRVADVSDGMDMAGLYDVGLMSPEIRPLWRDTVNMDHRFIGIAVTVRYVPTNKRPGKMSREEFKKWEGDWYTYLSSAPYEH